MTLVKIMEYNHLVKVNVVHIMFTSNRIHCSTCTCVTKAKIKEHTGLKAAAIQQV